MKACCCCSARIGSFVGLTLSVIFSLAFGGFFWSGGAENFSVDAATRAIEFCQYPKNITAAYREPSVCNHDKDPCTLVDDVTATIDDYTEDITTQNALGGLFGVPLLLGIIAVVVGFIGVCMKSGILTKSRPASSSSSFSASRVDRVRAQFSARFMAQFWRTPSAQFG